MDLLGWLKHAVGGKQVQVDDRIDVLHDTGSVSTLWLRSPESKVPAPLKGLGGVYEAFDGADLFSSTFKIASLSAPRMRGSVPITPTLEQIAEMAVSDGCRFPPGAVPFMMQAGIGFYAVDEQLPKIYEWDTEYEELAGEYEDVSAIFDEWLEATRE